MQLDIAAWGWEDPHWASLYPQDLPQEWRLDFYANEYLAMVVPQATWFGEDRGSVQEWCAGLPERFRLYWEVDSHAAASRLAGLLALEVLQRCSAGYWWRGGLEEGGWGPLRSLLPGVAWCAPPLGEGQAAADGLGLCWTEQGELTCTDPALAVWPLEAAPRLPEVRRVIEQQRASGCECLLIPVMPHAGGAQSLQQLQTLAILLNG